MSEPRTLKALTIWQPWASLIIEGAKPYEFRGHRPPSSLIGQRIIIHAGKRSIKEHEVLALLMRLAKSPESAAGTCLHKEKAIAILNRGFLHRNLAAALPISAAIGTAILGSPRDGLDVAAEFGASVGNDSDRDEKANWAWPMLDIERWDEPIPMSGRQGFWNWPMPEDAL